MGKVSGENEGLVAGFTDGVAEAVIVAVEADKDSPGFDMSAKIFARHHVRLELGRNSPSISTCK